MSNLETPEPRIIPVVGCACRGLNTVIDAASVAGSPADAGPAITVIAFGTPGPQGSKSFTGIRSTKTGGRAPILVESSKKVRPWREAVADAATAALYRLPAAQRLAFPLSGPLRAEMVFTLKPPARIPAERYADGVPYPAAYPDTSKLVRSTEDALTGILWKDDAQVVRYGLVEKLYLDTPGALEWAGAVVRIWPIGGAGC